MTAIVNLNSVSQQISPAEVGEFITRALATLAEQASLKSRAFSGCRQWVHAAGLKQAKNDGKDIIAIEMVRHADATSFLRSAMTTTRPMMGIVEIIANAADATRIVRSLHALSMNDEIRASGSFATRKGEFYGVLALYAAPRGKGAKGNDGSLPTAALEISQAIMQVRDAEIAHLRQDLSEMGGIAGAMHNRMADMGEDLFKARRSLRLLVENLWREIKVRRRGRPVEVMRPVDVGAQQRIAQLQYGAIRHSQSSSSLFSKANVNGTAGLDLGLFVNHTHSFGGLEQCLCDFAAAWRSAGANVTLIARDPLCPNDRIVREFGGPVISLEGQEEALATHVAALGLDALFVNATSKAVASIAPETLVIEILHNIYYFQRGGTDRALNAMRARSDWFVGVAPIATDYGIKFLGLPAAKSSAIAHGLRLEGLYRPALRWMQAQRAKGPFRALVVGNAYPQKNILSAIEAIAEARRQGVDVELDIAGGLNHRETGERMKARISELGLGTVVRIHGSLGRRALSRLYSTVNVLLFPSLYEGFGLVSLEARHFGLPIIATRTGYAEQLIVDGKDGILLDLPISHATMNQQLVDVFSHTPGRAHINQLAAAIKTIVHNYPQFAAAAEQRMEEAADLTVERTALSYLDLVKKLKKNKTSR